MTLLQTIIISIVEGLTEFFIPYIKIASAELENRQSDIYISERDDELMEFIKNHINI